MVRVIDSIERIESLLAADVQNVQDEEVIFNLSINEYTEPVARALVRCAQKYINAGFVPSFKIQVKNFDYTANDFENLINLESSLGEMGVDLKFTEFEEEYSVDEALSAFFKCDDFANFVKQTNASPFEKYLMIYRYLTSMVYKENDEHPLKARQLISVMNSNDIVCVGYSKLMKYLCNAVGIKCETQKLKIFKKNSSRVGVHQTNIVYIKDDKYGIDGYYYADSCWDSIKKNKEPFLKYLLALVPVNDVQHIKDKKFEFFPSTAALYDCRAIEEMLFSKEARKELSKKFDFEFQEPGLPEYFRETNSTGSRLVQLSNQVKQMFIDAGIPADYLSKKNAESFPKAFYPEFFIALMAKEPPETNMVNFYLNQIKNSYGKQVECDDGMAYTKHQYTYGYDDIYREFDNFADGDFNFNIWDIGDYYESIDYVKAFDEFMAQARETSTPISMDTFGAAVYNSLLAEGVEERYARVQAERAMESSMKKAERFFDIMASNCFTKAAIEKRKQKQQRG